MSGSFEARTATSTGTVDQNLNKIIGIAAGLVTINILLMLALSYTPAAVFGRLLFGNFFVGIAVFAVTVGGGFWIASKGTERGNMLVAGAGVCLTQAGYGLFGATVLGLYGGPLRIPAIGISAVLTAVVTGVIAYVVFTSERDFSGWQNYAFYCFIGGFAVGAAGFFISPLLMVVAGFVFFLGFVVDLTYEIWAVRANRYASDLRNAIGIYVAVMGVFIHILQWVLRILSMFDE